MDFRSERHIMRRIGTFAGLLAFFILINSGSVLAGDRLIFAIDIVRHGDRNPVIEIPKSPHQWDGELSALTQTGIEREHQLGKFLRREYIYKSSLLSEQLNPATLYVRSTETKRTIRSAKALLSGLYPQEFSGGLEIPVEVVEKDKDDLLLVKPSGNLFSSMKIYFWKRTLWRDLTVNLQEDLQKWREVTGLKISTLDDLDALADNLLVRKHFKVALPQGIDPVSAERIIDLNETATVSIFKQKEISRPTGLRILSAVKRYFDDSIQGKSQLKYVLYSAHDATIMSVLSTLGVKFKIPEFGARLHFGLYQVGSQHELRVTLENQPVLIPACGGTACSMVEMASLLEG